MTAPTRVGRYQIVRQIGHSMTDVYLAIDTMGGNRKTVLKLVRSTSDSHSRLVVEAERRGADIQRQLYGLDPRVVEVYETGDLDGYFFVAMQYVEGRDLGQVLHAEHTIDSIRAAAIALEICEQLSKFHTWRSAVVHGDIKPSNIHLGPNDTVRLLDFGIAKTLRDDCDSTYSHFGSPSYCSPERLTRSEIDEQSDLWAVGATLYQMISGSPPYQAESTRKLEDLIRSKRPPRALPSSCPSTLRAIAMKALAPDAARRYRTAREFQSDLQAFLENRPVRAELEGRHGWHANATIQRIRKVTRTVVQFHRHIQVASGVSWFLLGMSLWIGGTLTWRWVHEPPLLLRLPAVAGPTIPTWGLDRLPGMAPDPPQTPGRADPQVRAGRPRPAAYRRGRPGGRPRIRGSAPPNGKATPWR